MKTYVYILSNQKNGALHIGVTSNLVTCINEHKLKLVEGVTQKYKKHLLVHYEIYDNNFDAKFREECLKEWPRKLKIDLIESRNQNWEDLYNEIA